ncbi:MAG TPA: cysteine desulfurase [Gammaproteobacteria bacterium]|jgi:cysteine desulfurase|nr:cysteine desulfurase [Gammaproteobacteria bacterium]HIK76708.1 cysteine desulfurase [Gammaproteobacteria bacterium]
MKNKIYFDYASTTPIAKEVKEDIGAALEDDLLGNASSLDHEFGVDASQAIELARQDIAELINAETAEIIWTSGATESNNLALYGVCNFKPQGHPLSIASSYAEHKSVIEPLMELKRKGHRVEFIEPNKDGYLDPASIAKILDRGLDLFSCMHVNNEIGSVNDIALIGSMCREKNIIFHVDAAQSIGKLPVDVEQNNIDLMSLSAHKIYGPKGIGALFINQRTVGRLQPLMSGGGQERAMRPGTLATHQIIGMAAAYRLAKANMENDLIHLTKCRDLFLQLTGDIEGLMINGDTHNTFPGIMSISLPDLHAESLLFAMDKVAISKGSACSSESDEPSHVLKSMGLGREEIEGTVRVSFGRNTRFKDIEVLTQSLKKAVDHLRLLKGGI